jgi:hypothetical protein
MLDELIKIFDLTISSIQAEFTRQATRDPKSKKAIVGLMQMERPQVVLTPEDFNE